jgi:hypothetical protein
MQELAWRSRGDAPDRPLRHGWSSVECSLKVLEADLTRAYREAITDVLNRRLGRRALVLAYVSASVLGLAATSASAATFPLKQSANGRYLVDQTNTPFRVQSDAAWLMSTRGSAADVDSYLADRKAKGFNAFVLMAIVNTGYGGNEPANRNGDQPFTTAGDFSTPNEAYFTFVDSIIDKAAAQGMAVLFFYTYLGYQGGNQGWWSIVNQPQNTQAVCLGWGNYLGNRYKNRANILWESGGDYSAPTGEGVTRVHKILEGIRAAGATQLNSAQWGGPSAISTDEPGFTVGADASTGDINWQFAYGYGADGSGTDYDGAKLVWAYQTPAGKHVPGFVGEPTYENNSNGPPADRASIRAYELWGTLAGGIVGQAFGTEGIWDFTNYSGSLNSPGSRDVSLSFKLFSTLPWHTLVPEGTPPGFLGRTLIVAGQGTGFSHITAAATIDGTWLLAYVPSSGASATKTFSVDLRSMGGSSRGRWWNPTTGVYSDITAGARTLANTASAQSFTTPGANGSGANDWVLVLDTGGAVTGGGSGGASGAGGAFAGGSGAAGTSSGSGGATAVSGGAPNAAGGASGAGGHVSNSGSGAVGGSNAPGGVSNAGASAGSSILSGGGSSGGCGCSFQRRPELNYICGLLFGIGASVSRPILRRRKNRSWASD